MPITRTQAEQHIQRARNGSNKDLESVLTGIVDGDLLAELDLIDLRARSSFHDDFLAAAIDGRLSSTAGSGAGTAAATTVAGAMNGAITMTTSSANAANGANATTLTFDQLNWKANQGGLMFEARLQVDVITNCYIFVGFTDTISTTVECPIFMASGDIDSDAADACGLVFDTAATTDTWTLGGVKADTDTAPTISTVAPVAATYQTLRVEVSAAGAVTGYIDGNLVGTVANAVTVTVGLTPAIVVSNRTATTKILTVDYIAVKQNR